MSEPLALNGAHSHRREVVLGYLLQVSSAALLLAQHFALPVFLGMTDYGRMATLVGAASLLSVGYDHGYNLLVVRKHRLAWHYLAIKLALLSVACLGASVWAWADGRVSPWLTAAAGLHGLSFVLYTFYVHVDIAHGQVKRVLRYSLASGLLLLACPLALHAVSADVAYAPALGGVLSLALTVALRGTKVNGYGLACLWHMQLHFGHLRLTAVKQAQISIGTIIDGVIVWGGVILVSTTYGFEAAAVYRVAMSAVGLMTQALPLPKQVLLKVARQSADISWARRYALMLLAAGAAQAVAVALLGHAVLLYIVPVHADPIYHAVLMLSGVPALRATLELQTILHDRLNQLSCLAKSALASLALTAVLLREDIYLFVVAFYVLLCAMGARPLIFSSTRDLRSSRTPN